MKPRRWGAVIVFQRIPVRGNRITLDLPFLADVLFGEPASISPSSAYAELA
jgi:hypothetical protein